MITHFLLAFDTTLAAYIHIWILGLAVFFFLDVSRHYTGYYGSVIFCCNLEDSFLFSYFLFGSGFYATL